MSDTLLVYYIYNILHKIYIRCVYRNTLILPNTSSVDVPLPGFITEGTIIKSMANWSLTMVLRQCWSRPKDILAPLKFDLRGDGKPKSSTIIFHPNAGRVG